MSDNLSPRGLPQAFTPDTLIIRAGLGLMMLATIILIVFLGGAA